MPHVSIISPTYCEAANVPRLFAQLTEVLGQRDWELIIVDDDSPDGTADVARSIAAEDPRMRVIQRLNRRGLAGAVIEGMLSSSSPICAVIDADLQHDSTLLPRMIGALESDPALDLVVASRYAPGAGAEGLSDSRKSMSRLGTRLARLVTRTELTDPLSGFFALRREVFMSVVRELSGSGFKILLDVLASARRTLHVRELPYRFSERQFGMSKLDSAVAMQYLELLLDKSVGWLVPVRLLKFALVGGTGVFVHMGLLTLLTQTFLRPFTEGQIIATIAAMTTNYFLNNLFTFSDKRLKGLRLLTGLLSFYAVCSVGAVANIGVAAFIFSQHYTWWAAGLAGILVGTVWNYGASARLTWGMRS